MRAITETGAPIRDGCGIDESVRIERRFRGPPQSGNGGYTCGLVGGRLDASAAEVTLRMPPPLERDLSLVGENGGLALRDGDALVAEGRAIDSLDVELPEPVGLTEAKLAREASPLHEHHVWPMCFVCGPDRGHGDGLRVICGPVEGRRLVAAPWQTDESLPTEDGALSPEMIWSALDCPSGLGVMMLSDRPIIAALGRLSAKIEADFEPGETYVAIGWPIDSDGRKHHTGSALFSADGELMASARAVWIELQGDMLGARTDA